MAKVVLKTAAITLSIIIGIMALLFGAFVLFCPKIIGSLADKTNNYSLSIWAYERQYNKTNDFNDLVTLVYKLNGDRDSVKTEKYCEILVGHDNFYNFCTEKDKSLNVYQIKEEEFIYQKYVIAMVDNNKLTEALDVCSSYITVTGRGYTYFNPFRPIVEKRASSLSTEKRSELKTKLDDVRKTLTDNEQLKFIDNDIDYIQAIK